MSTPNLSGQTEFGSDIVYSRTLALKSHLAAFNPAAYSPREKRTSSIIKTMGKDSTNGMALITAPSGYFKYALEKSKKSLYHSASSITSILGK